MAKIVLSPVTNGASLTTINNNFSKIANELQNKVAYRDNTSGETNTIKNDLDVDGNDIFNVNQIDIQDLLVQGTLVPGEDLASIPNLNVNVTALQTGLAATNITLNNTINTVNNNAAIEDANNKRSLRLSSSPIAPLDEGTGRAGKFIAFDPFGSPITSTGTGADAGLRTDLAATNGSQIVGFKQLGTGSTLRTSQDKMRDVVSVKDFGAVGDGVIDDRLAVFAALDYAKSVGAALYFPTGVYNIKAGGYVQSVVRQNVTIFGPSRTTDDTNLNLGAIILLDSNDVNSFFYDAAASHQFYAHNIRFRCAQYVKDRKFWKLSSSGIVNHSFSRVAFERVEKPVCYISGSYFQSASFNDVQFNDSGTFHSELGGTNLRGTLLTLNNVSHDGNMLDNTEKTVCDLSGVRMIQGTNFLLEGTLPTAGYTILKLNNAYDASWVQAPTANFNGFFSEWNGFAPDFSVDQSSGRVTFAFADLRLSNVSKYKLSNRAQVHITDSAFSTTDVVNTLFTIDDYKSRPILERCLIRRSDLADEGFLFIDCSRAPDVSAAGEAMGSAFSTNDQSGLAFKWNGGYFDSDPASLVALSGTVFTPNTNTTYGRMISLTPSSNTISAQIRLKLRGAVRPFSQFWIVALVKLPTFTGGQIAIRPIEDNVVKSGGFGYDSTYSGQTIFVCFNTRTLTAATNIGADFSTISATGVSGNLECYSFAIYVGNSAPRFEYPSYPRNIETVSSVIPADGSWVQGDRVWKNNATGGGIPGWIRVTTGAGNTTADWKTMAVLGV